jgi:hypothetical protein
MRKIYSHTKRSSLEKCPLQYFYQYYAPQCKPATVPVQTLLFGDDRPRHATVAQCDVERAAELRKLTAGPQHAGKVLHDLIAQGLRHPDWRMAWFLQKARERFGFEGGAPASFVERCNGLSDADARIDRSRDSLLAAVQRFFEDEGIRALVAEMLAGTDVLIEAALSGLPAVRGFAISGRIDFCSRTDGHVDVVDWKMGKSGGDEDSLQLAIYGIWASKKFSVRADNVRVRRVFLGDGQIEEARSLGDRVVRRAEARLGQDVEQMTILHRYGQAGHMEAFTPKPKEKVCEMCKFRALCPAAACSTQ